jgi:hypothetical protein
MSGWRRWVVIALALGMVIVVALTLALRRQAVVAKDCRQENRFGEGRYLLSFWSIPYRTSQGCFFQIPYMAGWGGNFVMLLPNSVSAFRLADGQNYDVDAMVLAGEAIRPFPCPSESGEEPPHEQQQLSASEVRAELSGNTFYRESENAFAHLNLFVAAGGALYGALDGGLLDAGWWHIPPDGHFCTKGWNDRRERCAAVYREGETFELYPTEGLGKMVFRRAPGNPEGY